MIAALSSLLDQPDFALGVARGQAEPAGYAKSETDFENLCKRDDIDLVYIATPWDWHVPMAVCAMREGKHAATEVPAALTLAECWELVDKAEQTRRHCIMLENCCYGEIELLVLRMVRQGLFGELTHGEAGYLHEARDYLLQDSTSAAWRRRFTLPLIAVTGSNGKTTVTQMIASILAQAFGERNGQRRWLATRGNLNNDIGLPLMLFELNAQQRAAVLELGMNHAGEIALLASIAKPSIGIVTNVGTAHIEHFTGIDGIAAAKEAGLRPVLGSNGTLITPEAARKLKEAGLTPEAFYRDYAATIFRLMGVDDTKEYVSDDGRPIRINNGGRPIDGEPRDPTGRDGEVGQADRDERGQPHQVGERLLVEADQRQVGRLQAGLGQAVAAGVRREPRVVLHPGEPRPRHPPRRCGTLPAAGRMVDAMKVQIRYFASLRERGNDIELLAQMLVRSYDPCISCATHALKIQFLRE